jgi:extradiol dioxygenase family protein
MLKNTFKEQLEIPMSKVCPFRLCPLLLISDIEGAKKTYIKIKGAKTDFNQDLAAFLDRCGRQLVFKCKNQEAIQSGFAVFFSLVIATLYID